MAHAPRYAATVLRLEAFKYELMPTGEQKRDMRRFAGSCRFVFFRKARALQKERYDKKEKKLGYAGLCRNLTEWRNSKETPWLKHAPVHLTDPLDFTSMIFVLFTCPQTWDHPHSN